QSTRVSGAIRTSRASATREAISELSYSFIPLKPLCFLTWLHRVFAEFIPIVSDQFPIFGKPSFCVFDDTDQIESEEKVGGRSTRSIAEMMNCFLHRIRSFTSTAQIHDLFEAHTAPWNRRIVARILIGT